MHVGRDRLGAGAVGVDQHDLAGAGAQHHRHRGRRPHRADADDADFHR